MATNDHSSSPLPASVCYPDLYIPAIPLLPFYVLEIGGESTCTHPRELVLWTTIANSVMSKLLEVKPIENKPTRLAIIIQ